LRTARSLSFAGGETVAIPALALAQATVLITVIAGVATHRSRDTASTSPSVAPAASVSVIKEVPAESALARSLIMPVVGVVYSALHDNFSERRGGGRMHEALDMMAPRGTPVVSATDGRLLKLHLSKAGGLMVYAADAKDQFILMYAHLDRYADGLVEGAPVHKGQLLGYVGTTGNASANAPHLHFAIARGEPSVHWWKGVAVDPYPLLANAQASGGVERATVAAAH
jgi:murein DD-endopeptidase MepM/ murein hydrolase activator NlpD